MKLWMIGLLLLCSLGIAWAVTTQAREIGIVNLYLKSQTQAQIQASTSTVKGQVLYCSDCAAAGGVGTICISTQTTGYRGFVLSTGTICK